MNTDHVFPMSRRSMWRLHQEAGKRQCSLGYLFRGWAYALAHTEKPVFDLAGQPLTQSFDVGINDDVYAALVSLADQLDVPRETIGELVASYMEEYAYAGA
jgi:hypothetical protein